MTKRQFGFGALLGASFLFVFWLTGLVLFVMQVTASVELPVSDNLRPTDAIVVLTGGSERVETGLDLLQVGKAKKLLISGVHPSVGAGKILAHSGLSKELQSCCITLGRAADNTFGNAEETRTFMEKEGFHSLRLVTAHYHMPRSLLFFHAFMPEIEMIPHPVSPDVVNLSDWWHRPGTASLLIGEYNKYLYAWIRIAMGASS